MKKIDIHCHTTNRKLTNTVSESATLDTIWNLMNKYQIEKTILLATYFPHKESGISNFRLYDWINDSYKFRMFGSLDFENYFYQGMNELSELAERGSIEGIKIYTCYQNIDLHSNRFKQIINLTKRYDLNLMFHTGYSYSTMRTQGKPAVAQLVTPKNLEFIAQENPDLNIIMSHMGKPYINEIIEVVQNNKNVYTDTSGLIDSKHDRLQIRDEINNIKKFLAECGSEQLLFGTDFPVQTHEDSVWFVEKAMHNYTQKEKQNVYYYNARRLLK